MGSIAVSSLIWGQFLFMLFFFLKVGGHKQVRHSIYWCRTCLWRKGRSGREDPHARIRRSSDLIVTRLRSVNPFLSRLLLLGGTVLLWYSPDLQLEAPAVMHAGSRPLHSAFVHANPCPSWSAERTRLIVTVTCRTPASHVKPGVR